MCKDVREYRRRQCTEFGIHGAVVYLCLSRRPAKLSIRHILLTDLARDAQDSFFLSDGSNEVWGRTEAGLRSV